MPVHETTEPLEQPLAVWVSGLAAGPIAEWTSALSAAVEDSTSLSDADAIDAIRRLEQLICVATAAQARLAEELHTSVAADRQAAGIPEPRRGQGVGDQVALARRESPHRGRQHLGLARVVRAELPCTWRAWREGRITEWKATIVARETACLSLEDRMAVDRHVAADLRAIERMGDRQLAGACQKEASRLDAAGCVARRRKAESERRVTLRPAPDAMTYLTALLPVKEGVAVLAALTRAADSARSSGDERTKGQVMADQLAAAVLGDPTRAIGASVSLGLVMTDAALFGGSDDAAHLQGFGPIPAELAREIVVDGCTKDERIWLQRLYASPVSGELVTVDARGRLFRGSLARFIRLRDQICRTPWCDAPIRQGDHVRDAGVGGATSAANGQGLCQACNLAKTAPGWRSRSRPDGSTATTTPTGHRHSTRPPPIVSVRRRELPALRVDYVLTG